MHIVVLMKRVPDTTAKVRPAPGGQSVDASGAESIISPYDEMALERAIQLRESGAATKLTVLCLGPSDATKEVRKALAMGADEGLLLTDAGGYRDPAAIAEVLAGAVRGLAADLVLCGWKSIDTDNSVVGGVLAAKLGYAYASFATKVDVAGGKVTVHREVEGAVQVVEAPLPAVVTAQKGLAEARFASLKGIMAAKKKPLTEQPAPAAPNASSLVRYAPPPERPAGRILGEGVAAVPELVRVLKEEVHVL